MHPEESAEWVIQRIAAYARRKGVRIPADILDIFRTPVPELYTVARSRVRDANNIGVAAIREIVVLDKRIGAPTVRVRIGLKLPWEWQHHYEVIYMTNFPWFISAVMQNAFLENPFAGETRKWRSI